MPGDEFVSALGLLLSGGPRLVARHRAVARHQLRGNGHGGADRGAGRLRAMPVLLRTALGTVLMVGGDIAGVTRTMILRQVEVRAGARDDAGGDQPEGERGGVRGGGKRGRQGWPGSSPALASLRDSRWVGARDKPS